MQTSMPISYGPTADSYGASVIRSSGRREDSKVPQWKRKREAKGRWCVSGHPGKLLRDETVTSPGRRESDPASDSCGFKKRVPQCGTFVTLRMRHKGVAITPTQPRRQRTPLTRDGFTGRGEERVSHVRYATRDLLAGRLLPDPLRRARCC
jgi:hypothetical protein